MIRALWPLATLAVLVATAAGCGHGSSATGSNGSNSSAAGRNDTATPRGQAVKFAECMRANGISAFPDPDASGKLTIDAVANGSSLDTSSAAFEQALGACKDLEPSGFTGHERNAQEQEGALRFAQCIRDHGVRDFPDPAADQPMIDTRRIPSSNRPGGMSILHAAMQKCSGSAAAAGVTGGP
jgi:hypothetical protein